MMTSCKKLRHNTIWSWKYTLLKISLKNADQAFLSEIFCLIQQNWSFWLILRIIIQFSSKNWEFKQSFYLHYFNWQNPDIIIIIINFADFQSLNVICVWTPTRIDLKFLRDLNSIKIYTQKSGFYRCILWLKVIAQNPSKLAIFMFFNIWSVKYTQTIVTSSIYFWKILLSILNMFTTFPC